MNRKPFRLLAFFVPLVMGLAAADAGAQATRTWVSGVGDDANPCSRTAPCKTFAGAISKTATGGEISVLDPGGYGAVTITKSITINGTNAHASILATGTNGVIVNITNDPNSVVILRNLQINGASSGVDGVRFLAGGALYIEDCDIFGFVGQGVDFITSGHSMLFLARVSLRDNTGGGVLVAPTGTGTATAMLDEVRSEGNGRGVRVDDGGNAIVRNSMAWGNLNNGFLAMSATRAATLTVQNSTASHNGNAGVYAGGALGQARVDGSTIANNTGMGLQTGTGGTILSLGNNRVFGNTGGDGAPTQTRAPM